MPLLQTMFQPMMDINKIDADADNSRFRLKAAGGGFFARLLGLGTKATITADAHGFRLQKTTFSVDENTYIPRTKIASTVCVVTKPLEYLILGLLTLPLFGLGLIFILVYFFAKKRVIIGVVSTGGTVESVKLKATDGHTDDIRDGMEILEGLIRDESSAGRTTPQATRARPASAPPQPQAEETNIMSCPHCGTRMSIPVSAAGRKFRCTSCREVFTAMAEQ